LGRDERLDEEEEKEDHLLMVYPPGRGPRRPITPMSIVSRAAVIIAPPTPVAAAATTVMINPSATVNANVNNIAPNPHSPSTQAWSPNGTAVSPNTVARRLFTDRMIDPPPQVEPSSIMRPHIRGRHGGAHTSPAILAMGVTPTTYMSPARPPPPFSPRSLLGPRSPHVPTSAPSFMTRVSTTNPPPTPSPPPMHHRDEDLINTLMRSSSVSRRRMHAIVQTINSNKDNDL
jgi:hypothetical protein